jgi:hypothetical protein
MRRLQRLSLHGKNAAVERDKEKKRRQKRRYVQDVSKMTKQSAAGGTSQEFVSAFDYLEFKDRPSYMTIEPELVEHWDQSSPEGQRFVKRVRRREQILDARAMRRFKKNLKVGGVAGLVGAGALISARNKRRELSSLGELMELRNPFKKISETIREVNEHTRRKDEDEAKNRRKAGQIRRDRKGITYEVVADGGANWTVDGKKFYDRPMRDKHTDRALPRKYKKSEVIQDLESLGELMEFRERGEHLSKSMENYLISSGGRPRPYYEHKTATTMRKEKPWFETKKGKAKRTRETEMRARREHSARGSAKLARAMGRSTILDPRFNKETYAKR